uniref:Uncharacterized protein n=1 Tax=Timema tahoe TaxID=61484 RepID=A0A7R9IFX0_9NEOP|nr:unnamed protein product [Timema tahoe]
MNQDVKVENMIAGKEKPPETIHKSKLSLILDVSDDNDAIKNNDKVSDRNEENRRLLSTPQKKIMIVPAGGLNTNGLKKAANGSNRSLGGDGVSSTLPGGGKVSNVAQESRAVLMTPTSPVTVSSLKSLRMEDPAIAAAAQKELSIPISQPANWRGSFHMSDAAIHRNMSMRSLASIGMGSTDGRKVTIRRVPTSPSELLNIVTSLVYCESSALDHAVTKAGKTITCSSGGVQVLRELLREEGSSSFAFSFFADKGERGGQNNAYTHCFTENLEAQGIEPGTSGCVTRNPDQYITEVVFRKW